MHTDHCPVDENMDVEACVANGVMCKFVGRSLREGTEECVVPTMSKLAVEMMDGNHDPKKPKVTQFSSLGVTAQSMCALLNVPSQNAWWFHHKASKRKLEKMNFEQFPANIANTRTTHKFQGRSTQSMVVSNWDHSGNWFILSCSDASLWKARA